MSTARPSGLPGANKRSRFVPTLEALEARLALTLLGQQLFPSDNPWNQPIANAPVAANSTAIMSNIISHYGNGRLHPDFSQNYQVDNPLYGIPYNVVHGNTQPLVHVVIDGYPDESDLQDAPIPANAVIEGDKQNGPVFGVDNRGDSHLLIYDEDNNIGYEFYRASRPSENQATDGLWHADQETIWNYNTNSFRTLGWTSADAAGLPILPGLTRPDEGLPISEGGQGVINHAIRFTLQNSLVLNQFLYPASHHANPGNNNPLTEPPMGTRFRLKAGVDISGLQPESKIIAQAMKTYGLILADNGSNFFFSGVCSSVDASNNLTLTWNDNDIQDSVTGFKSLTYSDFEVVSQRPVVTGLSVHGGLAGSTITVFGQNFSQAITGQLQVFFGTTPAASFTYVDDSHLTAVVPAGSGTVDVHVQSGLTVPANSSNVNNTIFGYGLSASNSSDRFTLDAPPTVAVAAYASPSPVTGISTVLHVLGADDGGAAHLTYSWIAQLLPTGASPHFAVNDTNAAQNDRVTFNRAGDYLFQVTISDVWGATVTSQVSVMVDQTLKSIHVTPGPTSVVKGAQLQFSALAFDQFGQALVTRPTLAWSLSSTLGAVGSDGLYTAPTNRTGTVYLHAGVGSVRGSARITVT